MAKGSGLLGIKKKSDKLKSREVTVTSLEKVIISNKFNFDLCEEIEINDFLSDRSDRLYSNEVNSNIIAGEILTEVYDRLSGDRYTGLYLEWLRTIDYNARTALRHRVRYDLFKTASSDNSKEFFATLPIRLLDKLHSSNHRANLLEQINKGQISNKKDLEEKLNSLIEIESSNDLVLIEPETVERYNKLKTSVKSLVKGIEKIDLLTLEKNEKLDKFDDMLRIDLEAVEKMLKRLENITKITEKS